MKSIRSLTIASILLALTLPMTGCGILKTRSDVSRKKSAKTSEQASQTTGKETGKVSDNNAAPAESQTQNPEMTNDQSQANLDSSGQSSIDAMNAAQNSSQETQDSISKDLAAMQSDDTSQPTASSNSIPNNSSNSNSSAPTMNSQAMQSSGNSSAQNSAGAPSSQSMDNTEYGAYPPAGERNVSAAAPMNANPAPMNSTNSSSAMPSNMGVSNLQSLKGQTFEANYGNTKSQIFFESDKSIVISKETGRNQRSQERITAEISGVRPGVFMISGRGADQIAFTMIGDVEQGLVRTTTVSPDQSQTTRTGSFKKIR